MKTDRYNLEDLLAEVEHAGRDERRQQELGAMIDHLAGESGKRKVESGKRRVESQLNTKHLTLNTQWRWAARVAAAACVLFFIGTAVRVWFIPTESGNTMVAEADIPAAIDHEIIDSGIPLSDTDLRTSSLQRPTNALSTPYQRLINSYHGGSRKVDEMPQQEPFSEVDETMTLENVYLAEAESVGDIPEIADTLLVVESDVAAKSEPVEQAESEPLQPEQTVAPAAKPRERKRGFLSSLIRPAEPSLMEGTVLAFNIL